jgi:hypothetical protein
VNLYQEKKDSRFRSQFAGADRSRARHVTPPFVPARALGALLLTIIGHTRV